MRWTFNRKAAILEDLAKGRTTAAIIYAEHNISEEELAHWQKLYAIDGKKALKATRLPVYRRDNPRPKRKYERKQP